MLLKSKEKKNYLKKMDSDKKVTIKLSRKIDLKEITWKNISED